MPTGWTWPDLLIAAIAAGSVLLGLWRGLAFELMSLLGWVVAWLAAQAFGPALAPHVPLGAPGSALNQVSAFIATFVVVLLAWSLLARLVRLVLHATPLTVLDRLLGGTFGALRALVLLLALASVVALTPLARNETWLASRGATAVAVVLQGLRPLLPPALTRHLPG